MTAAVDGASVAKGAIGYLLDAYSSRPFGRSRVPYQTISSVLNDDDAGKKEGIVEKITTGQIAALVNFAVSLGTGFLATKIDSGFKYILGTISALSGVGALFTGGLGTFRKHQGELEQIEVLEKNVDKTKTSDGKGSEIVYSQENEEKVNRIIELSRTKGVTANFYGPHGTGKTQKARRLASDLVEKGVCEKAVIWDADKEIYTNGISDQLKNMFFGSGETIAQRIERLVANALAHHKKTGEYVVVILDEAHELFSGHDLSSFFRQIHSLDSPSSVDPNDRPATVNDYGEVLKRVKDQEDLKGIILIQASNTAGNPYEYLDRGFNFSIEVGRPGPSERAQIIRNTLEKELKNAGKESLIPTIEECTTLSELGTRDVFDAVRNVISHDPSEANEERFRKMDILRADKLVEIVSTVAHNLPNGIAKQGFLEKLALTLNNEVNEESKNVKKWKDEYEQRLKFEGGRPRRRRTTS